MRTPKLGSPLSLPPAGSDPGDTLAADLFHIGFSDCDCAVGRSMIVLHWHFSSKKIGDFPTHCAQG